jgi:hypothetical protein
MYDDSPKPNKIEKTKIQPIDNNIRGKKRVQSNVPEQNKISDKSILISINGIAELSCELRPNISEEILD